MLVSFKTPQMMKNQLLNAVVLATLFGTGANLSAAQYDLTIRGSDAIFLAGRTDVVIPPLYNPFILARHGDTPEDILETLPSSIPVAGGDVVKVFDPASGGINFFNGFGPAFYGPEGNLAESSLASLDGISGWHGPQGALAGVFLTDAIPSAGPAPGTLDFWNGASREFSSITPELGQLFFIGDGETAANILQSFTAPAGATRLFLGIPDGFGFNGPPGAYEDNDGAYRISIGVNEPPRTVPDAGATALLLLLGLAGVRFARNR